MSVFMNCEGPAAPNGVMARGQLCQTVKVQGAGGAICAIFIKYSGAIWINGPGRLCQTDKMPRAGGAKIIDGQGQAVPKVENGPRPAVLNG